jgi:MipA family protein
MGDRIRTRLFLKRSIIGTLFVLVLHAVMGRAEDKPLWEIGFGAAGLSIPDYRGSDERSAYLLPLPYVIYRGDALRVDREGVHGKLFRSDRIRLEISAAAGPPAKSDSNTARAGMPDIDPTIEIGPSLAIRLWRGVDNGRKLSLKFPLRAVVATDLSHFRHIGWVFSPHMDYEIANIGPGGGWDLGLAAGPLYATEKYHDYFYEVAPEFAAPSRPVFDARRGYSGSRATLTFSKRFSKFWVGAFARYDTLAGAVFDDSPLVKKNSSFMVGAGIAWIIARSKTMVQYSDNNNSPREALPVPE